MYFCAHTQDSSLGTKIKFARKKTLKTIKVRAKEKKFVISLYL
jgi:hypothetical protein